MLEGKYKQALSVLETSKKIQLEVNGTVSEATEQYIKEIGEELK